MSVCHGGNSDDLVSISAMTGTVAVNFCVYFNGLYKKKKKKKKGSSLSNHELGNCHQHFELALLTRPISEPKC